MRKLRLLLLPWIHKLFPEIFLTTLGGQKNISSVTKIAKYSLGMYFEKTLDTFFDFLAEYPSA
jgi:hypothetical protein